MLLDTDHCVQGSHLASFTAALSEAKRQRVNVALSRPSFELWLLLHHIEETASGRLPAARDVEVALRATLGQYNKTKLKSSIILWRRCATRASGPSGWTPRSLALTF